MGNSRRDVIFFVALLAISAFGPVAAMQFRGHVHRGAEVGSNPFGSFFASFGGGSRETSTAVPSSNASQHAALNSTTAQQTNATALSADQDAMEQIKEAVKAANGVEDEDAEVAEIKRAAGLAAQSDDDDDNAPSSNPEIELVINESPEVRKSTAAQVAKAAKSSSKMKNNSSASKPESFDAWTKIPGAIGLKAQSEFRAVGVYNASSNQTFEVSDLSWQNASAQDIANVSQIATSEGDGGLASTSNATIHRPHAGRRHHRHQGPEAAPEAETEAEELEPAPSPVPAPAAPAPSPTPRRRQTQKEEQNTQARESLPQDFFTHYEDLCDETSKDCTRSMCRWLKMSKRDSQGRCSLFEWQLKSCDYNLPESRADGTPKQPLDCAIEILRRPNVLAKEVAQNVRELDVCVEGVPPDVNATCYVPLGLLRNEIKDWKQEAMLMSRVSEVRKDLANASAHGKVALEHPEDLNLQDTIDELKEVLDASDKIPGHFLVNEVREARGYLDRLGPIPAVRKELVDGEARARKAFRTTSLYEVKQAMVWLEVTIKKAKRLELNSEVDLAQHTVSGLAGLKAALLDLRDAKFQANVSVSTKSDVHDTLDALNASIHRASDAGLTNGMRDARQLLHELSTLQRAVQDAADATAEGDAILAVGGNKGQGSLEHAVERLNVTLGRADVLGLADNGTVSKARGTFDGVLYVLQARQALQKAQEHGLNVLDTYGGDLSDNEEEAASADIEPALEWGGEVGIVNGIDAAESTREQLRVVEHAKENMTLALATGNASLEARAGMSEAVSMLESAMETSHRSNTSAGVEMAKEQVEHLRALLAARAALEAAKAKAVDSFQSRSGFEEAQSALTASMHQAREVGLDKDAAVAAKDLQRLTEFAEATSRLERALSKDFSIRKAPDRVNVTDPVMNVTFHKTGLKVVDIPETPGGQDDGDEDFGEHIAALRAGIEASKERGEIDPKMQDAYEMALANRDAHELLMHATAMGEAAMQSKTGVEDSIKVLVAARREVEERGLTIGIEKAKVLLEDLRRIPPALDEIRSAILKVNVSIHTTSTMEASLLAASKAIELNKGLHLDRYVPVAEELHDQLSRVKQAYVGLKAASMQGRISLQNEDGEEAAMAELSRALALAEAVGVAKGVEDARELYDELRHMSLQHDRLQSSMSPARR